MFERRGALVHPNELDEMWLHEMKRLQLNVLGLHPRGGHWAINCLDDLLCRLKTAEVQRLLAMAEDMGITVEYEMHAMSWLMPRKWFGEHPEWFRMNEAGERVPDLNICASSPEALERLTERSEFLARQLPTKSHRYYFWLDDAGKSACHCPACAELTPSDQQMICLNAMLRGIRAADPQAKLAYIAYIDTMKIPEHVKPDEGIFLEYAPIKRRMDIPLFQPGCPENEKETAELSKLLEFFGTKDSQVLEYWLDNSYFSNWKFPPKQFNLQESVMRQDVADYKKLGFESVTTFACFLGEAYRTQFGLPDINAYGDALLGK